MKYSEIIPGRVYAGTHPDAEGWEALERLNVSAVINLTRRPDEPPNNYPLPLELLWFRLGNRAHPPLHHLIVAVEQAVAWLKEGRILYIHDISGRNRLGFFVIALLMRLYRLDYAQARALARQRRHQLSPRRQFVELLCEYEEYLFR